MRVHWYALLLSMGLCGAPSADTGSAGTSRGVLASVQTGVPGEADQTFSFRADSLSHPATYESLRNALERYRYIRDTGGWPAFNRHGPVLRVGDQSDELPDLGELLWRTGDLAGSAREQTLFTYKLQRALQRFQARHGLTADGVLGPQTRNALAVDVDDRILQLRVNLARAGALPADLGERYLWVNTAAFELEARDAGTAPLSMRVIVGRKDRQTPVFEGQLSYLVLNPYWHVPGKIARRDLIPEQLQNPKFFLERGIRVLSSWQDGAIELDPLSVDWHAYSNNRYLPYKLQQDPGPRNALGRIKFMLPNRYSVYLHDTPGKHLFKRTQRMFSAGCVRVEKPLALARFLTGKAPEEGRSLETAIASGETRTLTLDQPIPVYMVYQTAWASRDGTVHFRDDPYQRDGQLAARLSPKLLADNDSFDAGNPSISVSVAQ